MEHIVGNQTHVRIFLMDAESMVDTISRSLMKHAHEGEFEDVSLTGRIKDYRSALQFLQDTGEVDARRLGVIGSSFGGMVAVAAQDRRTKAMVTLSTYSKILDTVPYDRGFHFCTAGGKYTGVTTTSLADFAEKLKIIDANSIKFLFQCNDFQK